MATNRTEADTAAWGMAHFSPAKPVHDLEQLTDNDILEVPQPMLLLVRAGNSLAARKPLRIRIAPYQCPYCGSSLTRPAGRRKLLDKITGPLVNPRRCRACNHRYYAPLLICVRPTTVWATAGLAASIVLMLAIFWLVNGPLAN